MLNDGPRGIGGWLLVYVIWTALSILVAIGISFRDAMLYWDQIPNLRSITCGIAAGTCVWYLIYAWYLWQLIRLQTGAVAKIKTMIIGTPVFNTIVPIASACAIAAFWPVPDFGELLRSVYNQQTIMSLIGAYLIAFCWLAYFRRSRRVMNTWPEEAKRG